MAKELNKVSLYCKEGGSDKVYTLWLEEKGDGFLVNFNYGPRGGWVQNGTKTKEPVAKDKAQKIYEKLLAEKKAKGYTAGEDAPAFSQTEGAVDSGVRPMNLTPDDEESLEKYITDDDWCAQEKLNGKRILLRVSKDKAVGINKRGLECPVPAVFQKGFKNLAMEYVLDGELIGENYHVFDVLFEDRADYGKKNVYGTRIEGVNYIVAAMANDHVQFVPSYVGAKNKRDFVKKLMLGRKEGVVFKRLDAAYEPGRRNDLKKAIAVKVKFYKAIAPVVITWKKDKQSIEVGLREEKDGKMDIVSVGWVTVPTKYVEQVELGNPIRVKYLYATPGRQLYQAHLDPTDDGQVMADDAMADPITDLKFEGKEEE